MGDTLSQICQSVKCTTVDLTRLRWYEDLDVSVCEGKTTEIVSLPTHTHIFLTSLEHRGVQNETT